MSSKVNLLIDQAASFSQDVLIYDTNNDPLIVTEEGGTAIYTANASMRKSYQAANAIVFTTSLSNGQLTLSLTANDTAEIVPGRYVWDAILVRSDWTARIMEGIATVKPRVTE